MKTILITGATDGIGKLTALQLAKAGHNVIVHGRDLKKIEDLIEEIQLVSKKAKAKGVIADFSDLNSVREMAVEIKSEYSSIDVLINNAGVYSSPIERNKSGFDIRFVVNYFAPYVLTNVLLPLLKKKFNSRIINLSSAAQTKINNEAMKGNIDLSAGDAYAQSKLALTMWSFYLANKQQEVSVISVNPGSLLNTKMALEAYGNHWSPASKGANLLFSLALSEEYDGVTGEYFDNDKGYFDKAHPDAYKMKLILELIEQTQQIIN